MDRLGSRRTQTLSRQLSRKQKSSERPRSSTKPSPTATRPSTEHPKFAAAAYCKRGECYVDQANRARWASGPFEVDRTLIRIIFWPTACVGSRTCSSRSTRRRSRILDQAIQLKGDYIDRFNRGVTLSAMGRSSEALKAFSKLISDEPGDPDAFYQRAARVVGSQGVRQGPGRSGSAMKLLEPIVAADPNRDPELADPIALPVGFALAVREAKAELRRNGSRKKACMYSDWKTPWHIDALAAAYASQEDFNKASTWQQEALEKSTTHERHLHRCRPPGELLRLYRGRQAFRLPASGAD